MSNMDMDPPMQIKREILEETSVNFQDEHGYATMQIDHVNLPTIKTEPIIYPEYEDLDSINRSTAEFEPMQDSCELTDTDENNAFANSETDEPSSNLKNIENVRRELHCSTFNIYEPLLKLSFLTAIKTECESSSPNSQEPNSCPVCFEDMASVQALHRHVISEHPDAYGIKIEYSCPGCSVKFNNIALLDKHLFKQPPCKPEKKADKRDRTSCRFCDAFSVKDKDIILWHESTQHSANFLKLRFKCCMCSRHFPQFSHCKEHILKRECLNICVACKEVFPMLYLLAEHINKKHLLKSNIFLTTVNSLMCTNCGTKFQKLKDQVGHICPKYCRLCDVTFPCYSLFANHMWQLHHNWAGYCETCKSVFDDKSAFAQHLEQKVCKQCKHCRFPLLDPNEKAKHKCSTQSLPRVTYTIHALAPRLVHNSKQTESNKVYCGLCGQFFPSSEQYHEHISSEPGLCFGCRLCPDVATTKMGLIQHLLREHGNLGVSVTEHHQALPEVQAPEENENYGAITNFEGYCSICKQIINSRDDYDENHMADFKCIECSLVMRCKLNYMKHIARAHSAVCKICKKYTDFMSLHNLKRHSNDAIPLNQPVALFSCSKCNVHAFDLQVLVRKATPDSCQHLRSLWQFNL